MVQRWKLEKLVWRQREQGPHEDQNPFGHIFKSDAIQTFVNLQADLLFFVLISLVLGQRHKRNKTGQFF